jgi:hypothetical protein
MHARNKNPQAEACATIAAPAQGGAVLNQVVRAQCGEPKRVAERAAALLAEASRWVDFEV